MFKIKLRKRGSTTILEGGERRSRKDGVWLGNVMRESVSRRALLHSVTEFVCSAPISLLSLSIISIIVINKNWTSTIVNKNKKYTTQKFSKNIFLFFWFYLKNFQTRVVKTDINHL